MKRTCWIAAVLLCCGSATADAGLFNCFKKKGGCHEGCAPSCAAPAACCEEPSCCAPSGCVTNECGPAEPTCCAPAAPECCAPQECAPAECGPAAPSCCAPSECCASEPSCCAPTDCHSGGSYQGGHAPVTSEVYPQSSVPMGQPVQGHGHVAPVPGHGQVAPAPPEAAPAPPEAAPAPPTEEAGDAEAYFPSRVPPMPARSATRSMNRIKMAN